MPLECPKGFPELLACEDCGSCSRVGKTPEWQCCYQTPPKSLKEIFILDERVKWLEAQTPKMKPAPAQIDRIEQLRASFNYLENKINKHIDSHKQGQDELERRILNKDTTRKFLPGSTPLP